MKRDVPSVEDNSLRKAQALFDELASHCGSGADREIRAPTKLLLLLALEKFRRHGGPGWMSLLEEHIDMIKEDPEKYDRMIKCQRGEGGLSFHSESWRRAAPASAWSAGQEGKSPRGQIGWERCAQSRGIQGDGHGAAVENSVRLPRRVIQQSLAGCLKTS